MDTITARIEQDLIKSRLKRMKKLPVLIYNQLRIIEHEAFRVWKLDTVYTGSIMLDSFTACANSKLTLDQLESIVKNDGKDYKSFEILLKKAVKAANKRKVKFNSEIIKNIIGKATRIKSKV